MSKRPTEYVTETGWTDWIHPKGNENGIYKLECCDCGLVHDMQFIVAVDGEPVDGVYREFRTSKNKRYISIFRARRDNRATGQVRRRKREQK